MNSGKKEGDGWNEEPLDLLDLFESERGYRLMTHWREIVGLENLNRATGLQAQMSAESFASRHLHPLGSEHRGFPVHSEP